MFGGKKIKEAEERIQELEAIQSEYQTFLEEVKNTGSTAKEMFVAMVNDEEQLKQDIQAVAEVLEAEKEETKQILQQADNAKENLEKIQNFQETFAQIQQEQKAQQKERQDEEKKQQLLMQEIDTLCSKAKEEEIQFFHNQSEAVEHAKEIVEKMQESAGEMSVLALTAGIEAGRLGGAGKDFLEAAEGVRKLAEEYCSMLSALTKQIKMLEKPETETNTLDILKVKTERAAKELAQTEEADKEDKETEILKDLNASLQLQREISDTVSQKITESEYALNQALKQLQDISSKDRMTLKAKEELEKQLMPLYEK